MTLFKVNDPCVHQCELDEATDRCLGCGRRVADMMTWHGLARGERNAALKEAREFLDSRKLAASSPGS